MKRLKRLTDKSGEVRELTRADFARAVGHPALPESLQQKLAGVAARGRPKAPSPKEMMSFRLPADVIESIKSSGKGYNQRVEAVLRDALTHGRI